MILYECFMMFMLATADNDLDETCVFAISQTNYRPTNEAALCMYGVGWSGVGWGGLITLIRLRSYTCSWMFLELPTPSDAALLTCSWNFQHALDATFFTRSWNFQRTLDAMLLTSSWNFQHALDATLLTYSWILGTSSTLLMLRS